MQDRPKLTDRQKRLDKWLSNRGITRVQIAASMNVHPSMVGKLLAGQKRTPARIKQLEELGIPSELLPEPQAPRKRGPKPKHGANKPQDKSGGEG